MVGPRHTFADLAQSIDHAFARWDRGHLCKFDFADGTVVTDPETADEAAASPDGPMSGRARVLSETRIADSVAAGDEFRYEFDFGDGWTHACRVDSEVDPLEVLGTRPGSPMAYFGWGSMPDQYGRRWVDDDGSGPKPRRPAKPHPMLTHEWPARAPSEPVDLRQLRGATFGQDADAILAALEGRDPGTVLQYAGDAVKVLLRSGHERGEAIAVSIVNRLSLRGWPGDEPLLEDLVRELRGDDPPAGVRVLPVDLDDLASVMEGDPTEEPGYLDLHTGQVVRGFETEAGMVGEDAAVDVEDDPDRWLELDPPESGSGWQDMADFAALQRDSRLREQMERAIEGKGAFRRFGDLVAREGLLEQWRAYADDAARGRARAWLAGEGIRVP